MKPDGSGERILTEGFHNEGPTFSPNGRVIMFFRDPGGKAGPSLYTVDITGRNEQRVPTPGFAPIWPGRRCYLRQTAGSACATSATRSGFIKHQLRFPRSGEISFLPQRLVKVDGTFV